MPSRVLAPVLIAVLLIMTVGAQDRWCTPGAWCRYQSAGDLTEYLVLPTTYKTRREANGFCAANYGTLISLSDRSVRDTLLTLLPLAEWKGAWSGLEYIGPPADPNATAGSDYRFSTGEPFVMDTLISDTSLPCYAFEEHAVGLALQGVDCDTEQKVACQRKSVSTSWERIPHRSLLWKYFAARATMTEARAICAAQGGVVGFLPDIEDSKEVAQEINRRFHSTMSMPTRYEHFGMWLNLEMDVVQNTLKWAETHSEAHWIPPVDSAIAASCTALVFDVDNAVIPTVRFKTTLAPSSAHSSAPRAAPLSPLVSHRSTNGDGLMGSQAEPSTAPWQRRLCAPHRGPTPFCRSLLRTRATLTFRSRTP